MKRYEAPKIEMIPLSPEDIVSTSTGIGTSLIEDEEAGWTFD